MVIRQHGFVLITAYYLCQLDNAFFPQPPESQIFPRVSMMATLLIRKVNLVYSYHAVGVLLRSNCKGLSNCATQTRAKVRFKHINNRSIQTKAAESAQVKRVKSTVKRNSKQAELVSDASWSVIAYNLSEELRIENAHRLLDRFKEYKINDIPQDLHDEAVVLSLKDKSDCRREHADEKQPLHDVFLFREGSIVFWGVPYDQQKRILYGLSSLKIDPYSNELIQEEKEHLNYDILPSNEKSKLNRDIVELANREPDLLRLDQFAFSHAVMLSVKLGIWEAILDRYIESIGWITTNMKNGQTIQLTRDQVFRKTGEIYELKHRINLSSDLLDLPDVYWDRHDQEVMFLSLISFLNIKKRTAVMNEKLNHCCELMNLLSSHMNDKHHVRLEWMIIVLIMVEVLFEVARFF